MKIKFCATGQSSSEKIFYTAKYSPEVSDKGYTESLEGLKQDWKIQWKYIFMSNSIVMVVEFRGFFSSILGAEIKNFTLFDNDTLVSVRTYRL